MADPERSLPDRPQGGVGRAAARGVMLISLGGILERLIGFAALAVVVRLMTVEEAGIAMLAASVFDVILVVSTTGFGERLIQSSSADRTLQGTVFWLKMALCSALAVAFLAASEAIAGLFGEPRIVPLLQAMSGLIVLRALGIVPAALLSRRMRYDLIVAAVLAGSVCSAASGIIVALAGYPIWALVAQFVASSVVFSIIVAIGARWTPVLAFSLAEARSTIAFSSPLLASATLNALSSQASTLMIGVVLPIEQVAVYRIAARLFEVMGQTIVAPVQRVLLTTLSALRSERARMIDALLKMVQVLCAGAFCVFALVGAQGSAVMSVLFGPVWAPSGQVLTLLVFGVVGLIARAFVTTSLAAVGRTRLVLLFTAISLAASLAAVAIAVRFDVRAVAVAQSGVMIATLPVAALMLRQGLGVPVRQTLATVPQPLLAALAGAAASWFLARWLHEAAAFVPLIVRMGGAGLVGLIVFAAAHFALGPRRTRETLRAVRALVTRRGPAAAP
jgi:O-antigen/teichoic acid export membrane protein